MKSIMRKLENLTPDDLKPQNKRMYQVLLEVIQFMDSVPMQPSKVSLSSIGEALSKELAKGLMKVMGLDDFYIENFNSGKPCKCYVDEYEVGQYELDGQDMNVVKKLSEAGFRVYYAVSSDLVELGETYVNSTSYYYVPNNLMRYLNPKGKETVSTQRVLEFFFKVLTAACNGNLEEYSVIHSNLKINI